MKELHIVSTGVSLIQNAQKAGLIPADKKISDEQFWRQILDDPTEIRKFIDFLKKDPQKHSAELNTFLRVVQNKQPSDVEVYFFGTKTASNELCRTAINEYLKEAGYQIYTPYEVSGYFWEATFDKNYAKDEFQNGISELLDRLIYIARRKIQDGYKVYFNPTGGLKAHVIATAFAGFLLGCDIYYMNEEFDQVVFIPKMFYLPKGKEIQILKQLKAERQISGPDAQKLYDQYPEALERLRIYNLVDTEESGEKIYRIKITSKGLLFVKLLEERE
ncbi:MAG: putative CRISPR-associated protein [Candidatus Calescibacterium sp.]|nr:putative CRISPR-associated protein [Candidatus Calescibacterium sp.]